MSIHPIVSTLEKLISIHQELCHVSKEKTEILIEGSTEKLQHLIAKERKYLQLLEQFEQKRQRAVEKWYEDNHFVTEEKTVTNMLQLINEETEKQQLEEVTIQLTNMITTLKQQEQLNQDLLRQSLQLVQLSLDMVQPTIQQINYGQKETKESENRSVFDSQA